MIYIIIPVFNRIQFTRTCLESLRSQSFKDFKVVVVDDGSTDDTGEMLKTDFPEVDVLSGDGNLWWTASINLGIKYALERHATYILTLNNDTIAPEDFLSSMVKWKNKYPDALLGAFALDYNSKKPIYGGGNYNWCTAEIKLWLDVLDETNFSGLHPVDHFPGRGLLIPAKVFDAVGLFAEKKLPHYFSDYDFTLQAKKRGFQLFCNFDARLFIFPDESGDKDNRKKRSLSNYYAHLFGIKGGGNLRNFLVFAFRNCPPLCLPSYLAIGLSKRIFGYFIK